MAESEETQDGEAFIPLEEVRDKKRKETIGSHHGIDLAEQGKDDTTDYRIQAKSANTNISLWHDISLVHMDRETKKETPYFNFVCEIPKFTRYVRPPNAKS